MHVRTIEDVIRNDYAKIYKKEYLKAKAEAKAIAKAEAKALEKQETAIRLLKRGTPIGLIQIATDLPISAIYDIAKSQKLPVVSPSSD